VKGNKIAKMSPGTNGNPGDVKEKNGRNNLEM
jgi:hypothetical protein